MSQVVLVVLWFWFWLVVWDSGKSGDLLVGLLASSEAAGSEVRVRHVETGLSSGVPSFKAKTKLNASQEVEIQVGPRLAGGLEKERGCPGGRGLSQWDTVFCVPPELHGGSRKPLGIPGQSKCGTSGSTLLSCSFPHRPPAGLHPHALTTVVPTVGPGNTWGADLGHHHYQWLLLVRELGGSHLVAVLPPGMSTMS